VVNPERDHAHLLGLAQQPADLHRRQPEALGDRALRPPLMVVELSHLREPHAPLACVGHVSVPSLIPLDQARQPSRDL